MGLRLLDGRWYAPRGSAPSAHIVKAADGTFRDLAINEAICLETARQLDFDAAETLLIAVGEGEPLLAVKRFDRTERRAYAKIEAEERAKRGLPAPAEPAD